MQRERFAENDRTEGGGCDREKVRDDRCGGGADVGDDAVVQHVRDTSTCNAEGDKAQDRVEAPRWDVPRPDDGHGEECDRARGQQLAGGETQWRQLAADQVSVHVDVADRVGQRRGQRGDSAPAGELSAEHPWREQDRSAADAHEQAQGADGRWPRFVPQEYRDDHGEQRGRRVDHPRDRRVDLLFGDREQQVRGDVGEHGRDREVKPDRRASRQRAPSNVGDEDQDQGAEYQLCKHDLVRRKPAQCDLDPQKAGSP